MPTMSMNGNAVPVSIYFFPCWVNIPFVVPCEYFVPVRVIGVSPCKLLSSSLSLSLCCSYPVAFPL
jgi:hypothetical protein